MKDQDNNKSYDQHQPLKKNNTKINLIPTVNNFIADNHYNNVITIINSSITILNMKHRRRHLVLVFLQQRTLLTSAAFVFRQDLRGRIVDDLEDEALLRGRSKKPNELIAIHRLNAHAVDGKNLVSDLSLKKPERNERENLESIGLHDIIPYWQYFSCTHFK